MRTILKSVGKFINTFLDFLLIGIICILIYLLIYFLINYKRVQTANDLNLDGKLVQSDYFCSNQNLRRFEVGDYEDLVLYIDYNGNTSYVIEEFDYITKYSICFGVAKCDNLDEDLKPILISKEMDYIIFKDSIGRKYILELDEYSRKITSKEMKEETTYYKEKELIEIK